MPHEAQKKSKPFFSWITLKPAGAPSTRVINQSSSTAESWASPVFRQIGHRRISTQRSRSIHNMRPDPQVFQARKPATINLTHYPALMRCETVERQATGHHQRGPTKTVF